MTPAEVKSVYNVYMKQIILSICLLSLYALPGYGQGVAPSPSVRVSTEVEAPESSIDLLKKSLQSSQNNIATVGTPDKKKQPAKQTAKQTATPQQSSPAQSPKVSSQVPVATSAAADPAPSAQTALPPQQAAGSTVQTSGTQLPEVTATPVKEPATVAPVPVKKTVPAAKRRTTNTKKPLPKKTPSKQKAPAPKPTPLEKQIEQNNALLPEGSQKAAGEAVAAEEDFSEEEAAADAELEYAVKMLEASKVQAQSAQRQIPPPAAQNKPNKVPAPNKKFNPNAFRPGVEWLPSKSTHFDIYTQKRTAGVPSSNMSMNFEAAYQTLRRFIPWMMAGRVRVFVYQDHASYLRYEPNAKAWTRAVAYPTRGEIVVYDEPGKTRELKEVFTHELTHIFTQQFFDSHQTGRIMTPLWLDEGLAVFMEDQAHSNTGGEWTKDFKTLNFQRDPSQTKPAFASSSMFGSAAGKKFSSNRQGKPLYLTPFDKFMDESSLQSAEGMNRVQDWYFQAYVMVRFLLNPAGGTSPSNRMQFEQFTRLLAQGEAVRNPSTGFLVKDSRGKTVYEPYSTEKALGRAYRYNTLANFEDAFWRWVK